MLVLKEIVPLRLWRLNFQWALLAYFCFLMELHCSWGLNAPQVASLIWFSVLNVVVAHLPEFTWAQKTCVRCRSFVAVSNPSHTFMLQKLEHCDSASSQVHTAICAGSIFSTLKSVFSFSNTDGDVFMPIKCVFVCMGVSLWKCNCVCLFRWKSC